MKLLNDNHFHNFVLIGMAGAGKSTIAPLLAKATHTQFVDTDNLIAATRSTSLQEVLDSLGQSDFQSLEEEILLSINLRNHVIATGGSVIYSRPGMEHLREIAFVIWLDVELSVLEERVNNLNSRGLVNPDGMSFAELYQQRKELYREFADLRINCGTGTPRQIVEKIFSLIR